MSARNILTLCTLALAAVGSWYLASSFRAPEITKTSADVGAGGYYLRAARILGTVAPDLHSYMDKDGSLTETWAPRGLPTTFFIDPQGRKRFLALGGRPWDTPVYQNFLMKMMESQ